MEYVEQVKQLRRQGDVIRELVHGVTEEQARWRPTDDRWTILETVRHLIDIEVEDFRHDLDLILHNPEQSWPQFDIEQWRTERRYNESDLVDSARHFAEERTRSVQWLEQLAEPDLGLRHSGTGFGGEPLRAGDVLASWVAHDLFHIRQIALLRWDVLNTWCAPYSPAYSGFER